MKRFVCLIIVGALCGCTTVEFVRKDVTPQKQGILRHSTTSNPKREAEYKEKVNEKAREYCGGDFQITREYEARDVSSSSVGVGTGFGFGRSSSVLVGGSAPTQNMYSFVEFTCLSR